MACRTSRIAASLACLYVSLAPCAVGNALITIGCGWERVAGGRVGELLPICGWLVPALTVTDVPAEQRSSGAAEAAYRLASVTHLYRASSWIGWKCETMPGETFLITKLCFDSPKREREGGGTSRKSLEYDKCTYCSTCLSLRKENHQQYYTNIYDMRESESQRS